MSTRWQCAVCEAINDGGDTCSACGAEVTQTVMPSTPAEVTAAPRRTRGDQSATEIPVHEFPRRTPGSDTLEHGPDDIYERIDTRPRVRVYGCCLPIVLGILLAFLGTVTLLGSLLLGVP